MRAFLTIFIILPILMGEAMAQTVTVGSKKFTESYVLGEIAKKALADAGLEVDHKQGMGGTIIVWAALKSGNIAFYPEYTGTVGEEILKSKQRLSAEEMRAQLAPLGIGMADELGFNNTYALVMKRKRAEALGIKRISDLKNHSELIAGPTHEFLGRQDGWKPLAERYGFSLKEVRGIAHPLGYRALESGAIDIKDAYSTDADIIERDLLVLEDDEGFFPAYRAVFLYRLDAGEKAIAAIKGLSGTIDEPLMIKLNSMAAREKDYAKAAAEYYRLRQSEEPEGKPVEGNEMWSNIATWTLQHLEMVGKSMGMAIVVGLALGIWASKRGFASTIILGIVGVVQTIPSIALLAIFVPLMGIGQTSAVVALFLYSLLPIVRNTASGLQDIPPQIRESAAALGLEPAARMFRVFLPIASRTILAGIKTSTIINVGTATIATLIGAGGLGEPIVQGIDLNSMERILQGLIPAAALALLVQFAFDLLDRLLIPRGLRIEATAK